jgi:hypothetical protein
MDGETYAAEAEPELAVSDDELLKMLNTERLAAVGIEGDDDLAEQRETALEYIKGEMDDIKPGKGRSKAVSTDVADAIETVLPDLMEIFTGGEDVGTFKPDGPEDEDRAREETDYILEVFFDQNPGFVVLYDAIKDLLSVKTGIVKAWWDDYEYETEEFSGKTIEEAQAAAQEGAELSDIEEDGQDALTGQPLIKFKAKNVAKKGCAKIGAVDPANFAVSKDTILLRDTPYCVERGTPRAFQLLDDGFDADLVARLKPIATRNDEGQERARDTVDEYDASDVVHDDLRRTVQIHTHTIRVDLEGTGKTQLWEVITDQDETFVLHKKKKNRVPYAAGTPFRNPHRFYGLSLADKLIEIQRIKTVLMRMMLDNGYFSLNQRYEVSESKASLNTIADLLRNEPGYPVRSVSGDAVRPLTGPGLNFDVTGAIEYMATVAEQRSGVVRNAQGLNPDTLHDTKGGMEKLFSAAQRRVRMIARLIAETLVKEAFLNLHGEIRDHCQHEQRVRRGGKWVAVNPASWSARNVMTIEVGLGSGGREQEIVALQQLIGMQMQAVEGQAAGMIKIPLVTETQLYNSARRFAERIGMKAPELFWQDPEQIKQQMEAAGPQEPPPDPEMMKVQAEMELAKAKLELQAAEAEQKIKIMQAEADAHVKIAAAKIRADDESTRAKAKLEADLARDKAGFEAEMAREKMAMELTLAREKMAMDAEIGLMNGAMKAEAAVVSSYRPGGDLDK